MICRNRASGVGTASGVATTCQSCLAVTGGRNRAATSLRRRSAVAAAALASAGGAAAPTAAHRIALRGPTLRTVLAQGWAGGAGRMRSRALGVAACVAAPRTARPGIRRAPIESESSA